MFVTGNLLKLSRLNFCVYKSKSWPPPPPPPQKFLDLIINSLSLPPYISLHYSYKNLVLDQDNHFYLISLSILSTCLLDNVWILKGEVAF